MARRGTRLLGGKHRGRGLTVAAGTRPTESKVREALFSIWQRGLLDCRFLDLFAGSGSVGLEAWSRGAREVVLVEARPTAAAAIESNLRDLGGRESCSLVRGHLPGVLGAGRIVGSFDLAYLDPPYDFDSYEEVLIASLRRLHPGGEVAVETARERTLPERIEGGEAIDRRTYGGCAVTFYRVVEESLLPAD